MPAERGRPRRCIPTHPNRVLAQAIKKGLSTAVTLQGRIKNRTTKHLYESSKRIWTKARAGYQRPNYDFQYILTAENNIRKNGLQMLFEKAAAYGNTEVRRVKSSDDTIGPLNQRFNIGGALLREFAMMMYPFPDTQTLPSGNLGYPKTSQGPEVVPTHVIPELDFIDCVRQHVQVLNTQCYIFDVPHRDVGRYTNLFLLRVRPYLDRIYSEGRVGAKDFRSGTLKVLREIKNEIAELYIVRSGDRETVTSSMEYEKPTFSIKFFENQVAAAKRAGVSSIVTGEIERLMKGGSVDCDEHGRPLSCFTEKDVEHIWNLALRKARKRGSQIHRQLLNQFPSFWDIRRAILNNGEVDSKDGYILCSETAVETDAGSGRADILLLRREATLSGLQAVWRPVLLLDLKSRLGLQWSLGHSERSSESRKKHGLPERVVPTFNLHSRSFDDSEWNSIIGGIPNHAMSEQVRLYADAVRDSYEELVSEPCPEIPVGTLVVDAETDLRTLRTLLRSFVVSVFESLPDTVSKYPRTAFYLDSQEEQLQTAIVIHNQEIPMTSNRVPLPPLWKPPFNPLQGAYSSQRRFILNVTGDSPTSSGKSASRISRYWSGLQLIQETIDSMNQPDVVWLDLVDEFNNSVLTEARLRLLPSSISDDARYRTHKPKIKAMVDSISIHGLFQSVQDYLFNDNQSIQISSLFGQTGQRVVIVSGWDWIQSTTPEFYRKKLNSLIAVILDQIPEDGNTSVIWFDSAVPSQANSSSYSTRALLPFYQNSPLNGEVTEIVWNFPTAPRNEISSSNWILPFDPIAPCYDDIRVLIHQTNHGYNTGLTQVPPLLGWSNRFRAESSKYAEIKPRHVETEDLIPDSDTRDRMKILALSLLPWFRDLYPSQDIKSEASHTIEVNSKSLEASSKYEPSLLDRIRIYSQDTQGSRAFSAISIGKINSQKSYHSPSELKAKSLPTYHVARKTIPLHNNISFGQVISLLQSDFHTELLVIEDPYNLGRMLVGMFTESSAPSETGFIWTKWEASRLREILDSNPDDIQIKQQQYVLTEDGLCYWEKEQYDSKWTPVGRVELISGQGGRFAILNGIKVIPDSLADVEEPINRFSDNFEHRVRLVLEKTVKIMEQTKSVSVKLVEGTSLCEISFIDSVDNEVLHNEILQGTCDVISLLKHPITVTNTLRTPLGYLLSWNPFNDVDYGKFDHIRSLVETSAPRDVSKTVAPILTDLLESEDATIELLLKHDPDICPILTSDEKQHGKCWRILSENEDLSLLSLVDSLYSGREIYGILTTGRIRDTNNVYSIDLKLGYEPNEPDFFVYHEDMWIRRLLHENDIHLKKLTPGTFTQIPDQTWTLNFSLHDNILEWIAVSNTTGFLLKGRTFTYALNPTYSRQESISHFSNIINHYIDIKKITNFDDSINILTTQLENYGYGDNPPPCRLEATRDENTITMTLVLSRNGSPITLVTESILLSVVSDQEEFLEALYYRLEEGDLSEYNIGNVESFLEKLQGFL